MTVTVWAVFQLAGVNVSVLVLRLPSVVSNPVIVTVTVNAARHRVACERLGPGRVLTGLVRQINPDAELATADSYAALEAYAGGSQE